MRQEDDTSNSGGGTGKWIVRPNAARAVKYMARAGGAGVAAAQKALASLCLQGVGVARNIDAARGMSSDLRCADSTDSSVDAWCLCA